MAAKPVPPRILPAFSNPISPGQASLSPLKPHQNLSCYYRPVNAPDRTMVLYVEFRDSGVGFHFLFSCIHTPFELRFIHPKARGIGSFLMKRPTNDPRLYQTNTYGAEVLKTKPAPGVYGKFAVWI